MGSRKSDVPPSFNSWNGCIAHKPTEILFKKIGTPARLFAMVLPSKFLTNFRISMGAPCYECRKVTTVSVPKISDKTNHSENWKALFFDENLRFRNRKIKKAISEKKIAKKYVIKNDLNIGHPH
jgi:hypothetical protein